MVDQSPSFVHLHLHSQYSLLDGQCSIKKLIARIKELGMDAVAITDHGNLHGMVEFYNTAKKNDIKPILGIEAYVAPDITGTSDRTRKEFTGTSDGGFHLVLLAENNTGWSNLIKLSSDAYLHGFYYKPRMDKGTLVQWVDGLIAINGHLGSSIAYHLTQFVKTNDQAHYKRAVEEAKWHAETFKPGEDGEPRFYIELQKHIPEQEAINPYLIQIARELDLPLVCDNDSHFLTEEDYEAHDALVCISTGKLVEDEKRLKYPIDLFVTSPQQMHDKFADYHDGAGMEALENTVKIAARCNVEIDFSANHAPVVKLALGERVEKLKGKTPHDKIKNFPSEHRTGSSAWFKDFCSCIELHPYDQDNDHETTEQLKEQCDEALRLLTEAGAIWRYGPDGIDEVKRARIERELKVLADKLISAYFLIVWDFVNWARQRAIPSNARGSGVGTIVGYCLGLSNACPVHYGLLFERFTDPDRTEYPDIDIDICQNGRGKVIDYVRQKYGHVAQIITFGTLKAKAVIRDVGRVLNMPLPDVDRIAKLVPNELKMTLDKALNDEPDLKKEYDDNFLTRKMIDIGKRLEGLTRHASVHAAGVILATQPLDNIVPLYKASGSDDVITQWDGPTCESVGLLKMDFLGLRTLSIIERSTDLVRATLDRDIQIKTVCGEYGKGPQPDTPREFNLGTYDEIKKQKDEIDIDPLDLERLIFTDQNVLDLFRRGDTSGVFQFESGGMRNLLMAMKPSGLEDLIAANALYRPGPMALIPDYNDRKHGRAEVPKVHEIVDRLTEETYSIMIYQEQVMQVLNQLGDIPLRKAYSIIKAISKKKKDVINSARVDFIKGAGEKGVTKAQADELFDLIVKFAGYGFNKSHSTGYAIVAYQTAFMKTYFPIHYMAAVLTYESISTDKVVEYIEECKKVRKPGGTIGIDVRPPDINRSYHDFTVVYDANEPRNPNSGHIRFGLGAVKGVGRKVVDEICRIRDEAGPFTSLFNFCERIPQGTINKSALEAMIKCGAFDALHGTDSRAAMVGSIETAISRGAQDAALRNSDDFLFGAVEAEPDAQDKSADEPELPSIEAWDLQVTLKYEKDVLGFYVSSHPMDQYRPVLEKFASVSVKNISSLKADVEVTVGGMLTRVRPTFVKNGRSAGQKMAMLTIEDQSGSIDAVVFSDSYAKTQHLLQNEAMIFLKGKVDRRREEPSIVVNEVIPVEEAAEKLTKIVRIRLSDQDEQGQLTQINGELSNLRSALRQQAGSVPVYFEIHEEKHIVTLRSQYAVKVSQRLPQQISDILQRKNCCQLIGPTRQDADRTKKLTANEPVVVNRLNPQAAEKEVCDSIDRY